MYELSQATAQAAPFMDPILAWGLAVIHAFQSISSPTLTAFARAVTFLGEPWIYLAVLPLVYWCVDERRGFRLAMALFLANGIVNGLKTRLAVPRPGTRDPLVELIARPKSWSTPSGHAAESATLWPILALSGGTTARRAYRLSIRLSVALGVPLLVGLSRVYLGVHYPTDVLFGWAIGALFSTAVLVMLPALERHPAFAPVMREDATGALASVRRSLDAYRAASGKTFISLKLALAAAVAFALNALCPEDSSMGGAVFGFAAGYILLTAGKIPGASPDARFSARTGTAMRKAARVAVGIVVLIGLSIALKRALPGVASPYYTLARFIRYGLLGLWASWGAPVVFLRTGLAQAARQEGAR